MKADEPRANVKFGMATDETPRIVQRHFDVTEEQHAIAAGVLDHNLRTACIAKALLDRVSLVPAPAPVAAPEVAPPPAVVPPAMIITERARPDNLRERLGLR